MKRLVIALMVLAAFAFVANAGAPPGGWGADFSNWITYSGAYYSGHTLWNSTQGKWNSYEYGFFSTAWPPFSINLYNEMSMIETMDWSNAVIHRTGNVWDDPDSPTEHICLTITGTIRSNHALLVGIETGNATYPWIDQLYFVNNALGGTHSVNPEQAIPVTWSYNYGDGLVVPSPQNDFYTSWDPQYNSHDYKLVRIPACDHWFQVRACFDLPYHFDDGHWTMQGFGCPTPIL
jgi:hypothetical protein